MGEVAESICNGDVCEMCGCWLCNSLGCPTTCIECGGTAALAEDEEDETEPNW